MDDSLIYPRPKLDDDEHNFFSPLRPKSLIDPKDLSRGGIFLLLFHFFPDDLLLQLKIEGPPRPPHFSLKLGSYFAGRLSR